jgi:hypothetical protein
LAVDDLSNLCYRYTYDVIRLDGEAMVRTQIQLTEEQSRALKALAARRGVSVAELVRQSVDNLVQSSIGLDDKERRRRAVAAAGKFRSGQADIAARHDDYLAKAYARLG